MKSKEQITADKFSGTDHGNVDSGQPEEHCP